MSRLLCMLCACVLLIPASLRAQVLYVDVDARGAATGASWADAFTDLQDALAVAELGTDIWVAEGTYYPTDGTSSAATFQLASGVGLYGGFGGSEMSLDQRDWDANPTVLSGDIGIPETFTDNVYQVVTGSGTDRTAILDGFTITAGYASGTFQRNRGGGMRNVNGSPTVRHCIFRENRAARNGKYIGIGAGMFNTTDSSPLLEDVRFERNVSAQNAGGLGNRVRSHPVLRNVVFLENEAGSTGGGMTNESGSAPVLIDVQFIRNTAAEWTGGLDNYIASPSLYNVMFYGNTCGNYGCGMTNDTDADALIVNTLFVGNRKLDGGEAGAAGLQNNGSSPTLIGVTFAGNTAPDGSADGLGHRESGTVTMRNVIFWENGDEFIDETQVGGSLDVSHALIQGGYANGVQVLDADPRFARAPSRGPDAVWGTSDDDYGDLRLATDSPALDAGDVSHLPADLADLDGDGDTDESLPLDLGADARVLGSAPDLGAYEGGVTVSGEPSGAVENASFRSVYPNPAVDAVSLQFVLSEASHVRLIVYDALGRRVARLIDAPRSSGPHTLTWEPDGLAAGVYWLSLEAGGAWRTRRIALLPS